MNPYTVESTESPQDERVHELVMNLKGKDRDAIRSSDYMAELISICMRYGHTTLKRIPKKSDREEILQECFSEIYTHIEKYTPERGSFLVFWANCLKNCARDWYKKINRTKKIIDFSIEDSEESFDIPDPHQIPVDEEYIRQVLYKTFCDLLNIMDIEYDEYAERRVTARKILSFHLRSVLDMDLYELRMYSLSCANKFVESKYKDILLHSDFVFMEAMTKRLDDKNVCSDIFFGELDRIIINGRAIGWEKTIRKHILENDWKIYEKVFEYLPEIMKRREIWKNRKEGHK